MQEKVKKRGIDVKKIISILMGAVFLISMSVTAYASNHMTNMESKYEDFTSSEELAEAYHKAVENEDIEEQVRIEQIARQILEQDMREVKKLRKKQGFMAMSRSLDNYYKYIEWS